MNFNKKLALLLVANFVLILLGVYSLATGCGKGAMFECLIKNEIYFNDFNHQFNIIKYISVYGSLPRAVVFYEDGGYDGISSEGYKLPFWREPLYYVLCALVYLGSQIIGLIPLLSLHLFSVLIIIATNVFFLLFVKQMSKFLNNDRKRFILYSVTLFIFLPAHLYIGLGIQNDLLYYMFFTASLYFFARLTEKKTVKEAVLFGLFIGLSMLSRVTGLVLVASLTLMICYLIFKKKFKLAKLYLITLLVSIVTGCFTFVRNKFLFGNIMGGILDSPSVTSTPQIDFGVFLRSYRSFWAGIEGGNSYIFPLMVFLGILLTFLTIYGLLVHKKVLNNNFRTPSFTILFFIIIVFTINWACEIKIFLITLKCFGYAIQSRFAISFCPFIALFSSLGLLNLEKKYKWLSKLIPLFVAMSAILFSIDFVYALLKI